MIRTEELLYELELNINKVSTADNINVPVEDRLILLNRAQLELVKTRVSPNNIYNAGFEETRKRIDDLQFLKVPDKELRLVRSNNLRYKSFVADLSEVPDYMFYVESYITAKTKTCEDTMDVDLIREGEVNIKYFSSDHRPSFEWRTTLSTISGGFIHIYTDGTFTPNKLHLAYLRYPKRISVAGYTDLDGLPSVTQHCELPEYMKQDIVDVATKYYAHLTEDQIQAQLTQNRLNTNE